MWYSHRLVWRRFDSLMPAFCKRKTGVRNQRLYNPETIKRRKPTWTSQSYRTVLQPQVETVLQPPTKAKKGPRSDALKFRRKAAVGDFSSWLEIRFLILKQDMVESGRPTEAANLRTTHRPSEGSQQRCTFRRFTRPFKRAAHQRPSRQSACVCL